MQTICQNAQACRTMICRCMSKCASTNISSLAYSVPRSEIYARTHGVGQDASSCLVCLLSDLRLVHRLSRNHVHLPREAICKRRISKPESLPWEQRQTSHRLRSSYFAFSIVRCNVTAVTVAKMRKRYRLGAQIVL